MCLTNRIIWRQETQEITTANIGADQPLFILWRRRLHAELRGEVYRLWQCRLHTMCVQLTGLP